MCHFFRFSDAHKTNTGQISGLEESRSSSLPAQGGRRLGAVQLAQVVVHLLAVVIIVIIVVVVVVVMLVVVNMMSRKVPTSTLVAYSSSLSRGFLT